MESNDERSIVHGLFDRVDILNNSAPLIDSRDGWRTRSHQVESCLQEAIMVINSLTNGAYRR